MGKELVSIELDTLKTLFRDIFWSENYFEIELPQEYEDWTFTQSTSKYDRVVAWYESQWALASLLWQILTVIDASVDKDKREPVKSIIKQLFYPRVRSINDDMFDYIDKSLTKNNQ